METALLRRSAGSHPRGVLFLGPLVWVGLGVIATLGCELSNDSADVRVAGAKDSAEIRIVQNPADAVQGAPRWTIAEVVISLPSQAADGDYVLYEVGDVLQRADGGLIVENRGDREILLFAPDGRYEARLGGEGQGPEEFHRETQGIDRCSDGRIIVMERGTGVQIDISNHYYIREALPLASWLSPGTFAISGGAMSNCSEIVVVQYFRGWKPATGVGPVLQTARILKVNPALEAIDTIAELPAVEGFRSGEGIVVSTFPFQLYASWAVEGAHIYWGLGNAPEFEVYDSDGRLRQLVQWEEPSAEIAGAEWDEYDAELDVFLRMMPGEANAVLPARDLRAKRFKPFYASERTQGGLDTAFRIDPTGNVWVRTYSRPSLLAWTDSWNDQLRAAQEWKVFSPEGVLIATATTPRGLRVRTIGSDRIVGVTEDSFGRQEVVAYKINREVTQR